MASNSPQVVDCERLNITVLLVANDATTLSVNAGFLRSWQYKVATATSGHEALKTLREFRGFFDLVIADLNIREMNGFELQKRVKREFNLPVIIMSGDGRNLKHGASYCIMKPVQRDDLKNVWQYVVAGKREKLRTENGRIVSVSEGEEGEGDSSPPRTVNSASPKGQRKKYCKRNRSEVIENEELIFCGPQRSKIFWTTNLHNRFLLAIDYIGMEKAVPTKILEIMNVPGLTRANVASHLQKYRMFLKKIAEKGILDGLSEKALRSKFAIGLPTDVIRELQKSFNNHFRHHENYYHQPYSTVVSRPPTIKPLLTNQTRLVQPNHYRTNHIYRNFQQSHHHDQANHHLHRPIVNGGGFMTSANALTANGLMSNYSSSGNNRNLPCGSFGLQRSPSPCNNHCGTQLNNSASLTFGALNRVQNVGYTGHNNNNRSNNNICGLLSNRRASNNAILPVSSSLMNVYVEPNRANISAGFPSLPQQSINGITNVDDHDQNNTVTSANQQETDQMNDLNELFLMLNDMVLPDETAESLHAGERSSSDILSSFNVEHYIQMLLGDGDHVNAQTSERSINVLPNKSSSCTNQNPKMVTMNDASTNLEPLNMLVADKTNSPSGNSTPREQVASHLDWDMDLLENLFGATDPSNK
ncbi:hypothetical protein K1719_016972 [Acacia pycnantha]|nr:hypothetical protein K1719_016972 [Acacia pycnantha]